MTAKPRDKYYLVDREPRKGTKICGWKLIEKYKRFNLWQYKNGIKECFYKNQNPNEHSCNWELK